MQDGVGGVGGREEDGGFGCRVGGDGLGGAGGSIGVLVWMPNALPSLLLESPSQ
jgi:hypothetical protein